jgi:hypothetical protein
LLVLTIEVQIDATLANSSSRPVMRIGLFRYSVTFRTLLPPVKRAEPLDLSAAYVA